MCSINLSRVGNNGSVESVPGFMRRFLAQALAMVALLLPLAAVAQVRFDVASIRPNSQPVPFERDGQISLTHDTLRMRAVSVRACVAFAYGVSTSQIAGPASLSQRTYDITAKAGANPSDTNIRLMLRTLLAERFGLRVHLEQKEMRGYILTVLSSPRVPASFHPSTTAGEMVRHNSASGTTARNITMPQFAAFLTGPLNAPVADQTGLSGEYDLTLDFTPYVDLAAKPFDLPSADYVLNAALKGELGLQLSARRSEFRVVVVDHVGELTPN